MNTENAYPREYDNQFDQYESNEKSSNLGKKMAVGAAAGVALGTASAFAASAINSEGDSEIALPEVEDNIGQAPASDTVAQATGVEEWMTFSQAFEAARNEVGPGGVFFWHGNAYGTHLESEWNAMSAAERDAWRDNIDYSPMAEYHETHTHHHYHYHNETAAEPAEEIMVEEEVAAVEPDAADAPQLEGANIIETGVTDDGINYAVVEKDEQVYGVMDTDNDSIYDTALHDFDGNGRIDSDEYFDIADQELMVKADENVADNNLAEPEYEVEPLIDDATFADDYADYAAEESYDDTETYLAETEADLDFNDDLNGEADFAGDSDTAYIDL